MKLTSAVLAGTLLTALAGYLLSALFGIAVLYSEVDRAQVTL